jgi:hypothetical protein
MAESTFNLDESRKLAVLVARAWSDPHLAATYRANPAAVLSGAGINLGDRAAPTLPDRPSELGSQDLAKAASFSSASSVSTVSCPCSAFTASCAGPAAVEAASLDRQTAMIAKLAEDPAGREQARRMAAAWSVPTLAH